MKIIKNQYYKGSENRESLFDIFYEDNGKKKPVIIFLHGFKGYKDWGCFDLMATFFAEKGFFFLKFNSSFNGGTTENPIDFPDLEAFGNNNFTKELNDLEIIIQKVLHQEFEQADASNIWLLGHSRGGGICILKAIENEAVKGVITLGSLSDFHQRFADPQGIAHWKKTGVHYIENTRTKQQMPLYYQLYEDVSKHTERLDILARLENFKKPFCIIHGEKDTSVLVEEAYTLKNANPSATLEIIPGANHTFNAMQPYKEKQMPKEFEKALNLSNGFIQQNL